MGVGLSYRWPAAAAARPRPGRRSCSRRRASAWGRTRFRTPGTAARRSPPILGGGVDQRLKLGAGGEERAQIGGFVQQGHRAAARRPLGGNRRDARKVLRLHEADRSTRPLRHAPRTCAVKEEPAEDDGGRAPDFQGLVVKEAQPRAGVKVVLIERGGRNSCTDQFLVTITARSRLLRESAAGRLEVHSDSVCVGDRLKVWFAGGVAESCPPQTTAETVIIVST